MSSVHILCGIILQSVIPANFQNSEESERVQCFDIGKKKSKKYRRLLVSLVSLLFQAIYTYIYIYRYITVSKMNNNQEKKNKIDSKAHCYCTLGTCSPWACCASCAKKVKPLIYESVCAQKQTLNGGRSTRPTSSSHLLKIAVSQCRSCVKKMLLFKIRCHWDCFTELCLKKK